MTRFAKFALWLMPLLFAAARVPAAMAQKGGTKQEVFAKPFAVKEQQWVIRYIVDPAHVQTFVRDGKESTKVVTLLLLRKTPLTPEGKEQPEKATTIWRFLHSNSSGRDEETDRLNGDAVVDVAAKKVYLVSASSSSFGVSILDLDVAIPELPAKLEVFTNPPNNVKLQEYLDRVIAAPDELGMNPVYIDAIKIDKVEDTLIVSIGAGEKPRQQWSVSLKDRKWHRIIPPAAPDAADKPAEPGADVGEDPEPKPAASPTK